MRLEEEFHTEGRYLTNNSTGHSTNGPLDVASRDVVHNSEFYATPKLLKAKLERHNFLIKLFAVYCSEWCSCVNIDDGINHYYY